jgi:hypothetical protein
LLGALIIRVFDTTPLRALEWASFAAHLVVLCLLVRLGRRLNLGRLAFLPALSWAVISLGSSFSFNGSLYTAQAALYLLGVDLMGRQRINLLQAVGLGIVLGCAYLLNYQAALLLPAFLLVRALYLRKDFFRPGSLLGAALVLVIFLAVIAPWCIRNMQVFGTPFYSVNPFYLLAKAGASFHHQVAAGRLVLEVDPLSITAFSKGLLYCAWLNIPYLLLLLMAVAPGCLALWVADCRNWVRALSGKERDPLLLAVIVILLVHLCACFLWPALKVRYLVPAVPLLLLPAWQFALGEEAKPRKWILAATAALAVLCAAVYLKGSLHGHDLLLVFLTGYFPMSLVCLVQAIPSLQTRSLRLPAIGFGLFLLAVAGQRPGESYFNLHPWPDFFGQDKDGLEMFRAGEGKELGETLHNLGITRVMGSLELWHAAPDLLWVVVPKNLPGENYAERLRFAASFHEIRHAVLAPHVLSRPFESLQMTPLWEGAHWVLLELEAD